MDNEKEIVAGSALDFSQMGFADAPAGKHGWIKAVGDAFEFEALPGRPQRFYGVNLCMSAAFPMEDDADRIVLRLARLGYNAVRLHHHDQQWTESEDDRVKMDRLVAACVKRGLYVTTDLYVSRRVAWRAVGIDRDGDMNMQTFKLYAQLDDRAFGNWKSFARDFLCRRNVFTGRRYVDEPALFSLCLLNEGGLYLGWDTLGKRDEPVVVEAWRKWLLARRTDDPSFYPSADPEVPPRDFRNPAESAVARLFFADVEGAFFRKASRFLRDELKVKALLTNDNCGVHPMPSQRVAGAYDFVDEHFYKDHPAFLGVNWRLPSRLPNDNPVAARHLAPCVSAFARICGMPFTVSEWNYVGPARFRASGGLFAGVMAALQGWSGVWRFSYAQDRDEFDDPCVHPKFFELARDPLAQAADRLAVLLFLRGDVKELPRWKGVALEATDESLTPAEGTPAWRASPPWDELAWNVRVGTMLPSRRDGRWGLTLRRQMADKNGVEANIRKKAAEGRPQIVFNRAAGSVSLATERTEAVFAAEGDVSAGRLAVGISGHHALVYATSLDGAPLSASSRILLSHLTDVQGDGTLYRDESRTVLERWGGRPMVAAGKAEVALSLEAPGSYAAYMLATDGRRKRRIETSVADGRLRFLADTGRGGVYYEIVQEKER